MPLTAPLFSGVLFALAAGLMWGLVFVGPLLLPEYPATLQSFGRYLAFGLIALPLGWFDRDKLKRDFLRHGHHDLLQFGLGGHAHQPEAAACDLFDQVRALV